MNFKQKIKQIIPLIVIFILISITCVFYNQINVSLTKLLQSRFNVVFTDNNLLVHFIDVGQGDAIAINLPNNEVLLIDCGPENSNVAYTNYIKENVLNFKHNSTIDYLILTHADADHVGGAIKLLETFDVEKVYFPIMGTETQTYIELETYIEENCSYEVISNSTQFEVENCLIEILGLYEINDTNESSTIVKLTYMNKSFLFMADVSYEVEDLLIQQYGDELDCDVIKIAHHGSSTSSSLEFLQIVSPEYSVISVGQNYYGHPTETVLNNIAKVNSKILRTDVDENILISVENNYNLTINTGNYLTTNFNLDYRIFVLIIDITILGNILIIIFKNNKKRKKKNKQLK